MVDGKGSFFVVLQADVSTAALVIIKYAAGMQRCTGGGFGGGVYLNITPHEVLHTFVPVTQFQRSLLGKGDWGRAVPRPKCCAGSST